MAMDVQTYKHACSPIVTTINLTTACLLSLGGCLALPPFARIRRGWVAPARMPHGYLYRQGLRSLFGPLEDKNIRGGRDY